MMLGKTTKVTVARVMWRCRRFFVDLSSKVVNSGDVVSGDTARSLDLSGTSPDHHPWIQYGISGRVAHQRAPFSISTNM